MAAFSSLTAAQQASVIEHVLDMRGLAGELARLQAKFAAVQVAYTSTNQALITSLDAASVIPDVSGLAGAQPAIREDILALGTSIGAMLTTYNSAGAVALYVKLAGAMNVVGR